MFCLLEIALFIDDFSISYIANYSAKSTPAVYKFASLWGSLDGSILLWNLILALYFLIYLKYYKKSDANVDVKIYTTIVIFFTSYTIFSSSPFAGCIELSSIGCQSSTLIPFQDLLTSSQGRGPNPLLQNHPLMAIHPPILYLGYIGLVLPFVITTSYLFRKDTNSNWVKTAADSTFYPWLFLTAGITLGAAWSYEVLGWGGYWAWDPVENVSFIPWLLATAFLHSSKAQISESTLLNWNYFLGGLMFLSTIFGTFITRSGVLISVHAFSNGNIGVYLLSGLAVFTLFFVDFFDTAGTLTSVANVAGKVDRKGKVQDIDKAMLSDSVGTVAGAMMGTTTVTSYVESGAGVKAGGRTGMTSLVIGVLFLACLFFAPLATSLPKEIDGAALLYVAILFVRNITDIDWNDIAESGPAVLAMIVMPLTYSISNGIALAFIAYALIRIFTGKFGKTSPAIWVIAAASVLSFYVA